MFKLQWSPRERFTIEQFFSFCAKPPPRKELFDIGEKENTFKGRREKDQIFNSTLWKEDTSE